MAYIVTSETSISDAASASFDAPIPAGHQANDVVVAFVSQDGGGTVIAVSGWTQIGTQSAAQSQRTTSFWKLCSSSSEADFSATGATDDWVVTLVLVRGADTTTPIHQHNRTDSVNSTTAYLDCGQVTTTIDNCLILHCWGFDQVSKLIIENPNDLLCVGRDISAGNVQIVGSRNQLTAGTTSVLRALSEVATEGGTSLVLAIADATPSTPQRGPDSRECYVVLKRHGLFGDLHEGITWEPMDAFTPAAVDGTTMSSDTPTVTSVADTNTPWGRLTGLSHNFNAGGGAGQWAGGSYAISSFDMSGCIFSLQIAQTPVGTTYFGAKGLVAFFEDGSGNWAAFTLTPRTAVVNAVLYVAFVDLENATPLASGGVIDWTDIERVGYAYHRVGTATNASVLRVKNALLLRRTTLIDGSPASPVSAGMLDQVMNGWGPMHLAGLQGRGQALAKGTTRYGDGARQTYVTTTATSFEFPRAANASIQRRFWQVPNDSVSVQLLASATDVIDLSACVFATETRQSFVIDPTTSIAASYTFAGAAIVGYVIENNVAGVVFDNVTFQACWGIELLGGGMEGCSVLQSLATPAVTTDDIETIVDTRFVSAGTGHAVELTATGTFNVVGLTFTGYGADGTTDAAIYNNSGGAVTLLLPAGGGAPTVRNGAGASTTIEYEPIETLVTVLDAESGDPVENARVFLAAANGTGPLPFEDAVSITRSGSTATVAHTAHGLATGEQIWVQGAAELEYNGIFTVTVTGPDAYTYTVSGSPATPATGTPNVTGIVISGLTDVSGQISDSRVWAANQPVVGRVRAALSSAPYWLESALLGTIDDETGLSIVTLALTDGTTAEPTINANITVDWVTQVISVAQAALTPESGSLYSLNLSVLHLALRAREAALEGIAFPSTHAHTGTVTVGGVTLAAVMEFINGYTIEFEDDQYGVDVAGANSNLSTVIVRNQVSVGTANSAGLVIGDGGFGPSDRNALNRAAANTGSLMSLV